uniref:Secreted protein n=1 Tax=Rhizophora mucronata TaxID=61149 RepID=A0A2P2JB10_RHIMU
MLVSTPVDRGLLLIVLFRSLALSPSHTRTDDALVCPTRCICFVCLAGQRSNYAQRGRRCHTAYD